MLANIGMVAGILLLVYELNQNREMMRAQTRAALSQEIADDLFRFAADAELNELWQRGNAGELRTESERSRYAGLAFSRFRRQENVYYQYKLGLYDDSEYRSHRNSWRNLFTNPGLKALFCERQASFSEAYVAEINELLDPPCP